jgi:hypothetical protein
VFELTSVPSLQAEKGDFPRSGYSKGKVVKGKAVSPSLFSERGKGVSKFSARRQGIFSWQSE